MDNKLYATLTHIIELIEESDGALLLFQDDNSKQVHSEDICINICNDYLYITSADFEGNEYNFTLNSNDIKHVGFDYMKDCLIINIKALNCSSTISVVVF